MDIEELAALLGEDVVASVRTAMGISVDAARNHPQRAEAEEGLEHLLAWLVAAALLPHDRLDEAEARTERFCRKIQLLVAEGVRIVTNEEQPAGYRSRVC
jgi:hypothetical protein